LERLQKVGYITNRQVASTVYNSSKFDKPLILEGPPGAGKTELPLAVARAAELDVIRLQCYEGIDSDSVIGRYDESLRLLYSRILNGQQGSSENDHDDFLNKQGSKIVSRQFYRPGPLLRSIERAKPCVLLIDEIDKVSQKFEAMLLQFLSVWELSIPEMEKTIHAQSIPFTVLTSNRERDLGHAILRRCNYIFIDHPTPEREAEIVRLKTPDLSFETHLFITAFGMSLRSYKFDKPPSISEMQHIAVTMRDEGIDVITPDMEDIFAPLFAKTPEDLNLLKKREAFASILADTSQTMEEIRPKLEEAFNTTFDYSPQEVTVN